MNKFAKNEVIELKQVPNNVRYKVLLRSEDERYSFQVSYNTLMNGYREKVHNGFITMEFDRRFGCNRYFYHITRPNHELARSYLETSNKRTWRTECNKLKIKERYDF